jgi:predicted DNA-binding transcriptional regulator AlpA
MAPKVDPNELVDSHGVADILGLSSRGAVAVYRTRYGDFPAPVVDMGTGRCLLWLRQDVEKWAKARRSR